MKPPVRFGASTALGSAKRPILDNESMYSAWSRHCDIHAVDTGVYSPLLPHILRRNLFTRLNSIEIKDVCVEMGLSERRVQMLLATDMAGWSKYVVSSSLRFCVKCLDLGYHSVVYQHVALACCPLHNLPLEDVCPHCKCEIIPTFLSAIKHPFECPHCDASLARTVPRPQDGHDAMLADQMASGRRGMLLAEPDNRRWDVYLHNARMLVGPPSRNLASRHYQRLCIWADRANTHWMHFSEETLHVVPAHTRGHATGADSLDLALAAERVFIWLRQVCCAHEYSANRLAHRLGKYPRGLRINVHGSLVGAALYKLAVAYDMVQEMQTLFDADVLAMDQPARATSGRKVVRYGASCPEEPELDFRLFQLEMLGMFAKFLVSNRHLDPMYKVSWLELPHPMEFAPTWKAGKSLGNICYRIRARVNETAVQRLVIRKWHEELSYVAQEPKTPDGFWRHNQLDTVWSDQPVTAETVFGVHLRPVDVPFRPVRPLAEMFTPSTERP